jgi:hypothetical protein
MKTLSVTEGRQRLGHWLRAALEGKDVGFVIDGRIVGLRPVTVSSDDYALREYGLTEAELERAHQRVRDEVRKARRRGTAKDFTGKL